MRPSIDAAFAGRVTIDAACRSAFRPRTFHLTAKRLRSSSVKQIRLPSSLFRRTRFYDWMYAIKSCCCRLIQPTRATRRSCQRMVDAHPHDSTRPEP